MAGSSFSVLCNLEASCSASRAEQEQSGAESGRSVPGQDLSLLPTSSPCAAAKPRLGKGLNFGFGRPLFPTLCHYAAQIEKTARGDRKTGVKREERMEDGVPLGLGEFSQMIIVQCFHV